MPNELLEGFGKQAAAFAWLVAAVVPVAVILTIWKRPLLPRWKLATFRDADNRGRLIFAFFLAYIVAQSILMQLLDAGGFFQAIYGSEFPKLNAKENIPDNPPVRGQLRGMWTGLFFAPLMLIAAIALRTLELRPSRFLADIAIGMWAWLPLTLLTLGIYFLVTLVILAVGLTVDEHPLAKLTPAGDGFGGVIFILSACVAGPLMEEILFRGLLVSWATGRRYRPWILMGFAVVISFVSMNTAGTELRVLPTVFICLLGIGYWCITRIAKLYRPRFPGRTVGAIYSSSVLFAAIHSPVWPSPIPLFFLALGLGWLTARTCSITAAFVVHGLFNAVATLLLFRG